MNRRQITRLAIALPAFWPVLSQAHRVRHTRTIVEWNAAVQTLDITHIFHTHDTETVLSEAGIIDAADLTRLRARAQLALYVDENFTVSDANNAPIKLNLLGAEIVRQSINVYQSASMHKAPQELSITCDLLRAFEADFQNFVDFKVGDDIVSEIFKGRDGIKTLSL